MNNDLISREDLQIEITKQIAYFHDRANTTSIYDDQLAYNLKATGLELAKVLIDNATAVEPFEPDYVGAERLAARQRGYADGYHNGMEIGKTLNPRIKQGEWIIVKDERYGDNVKCPFCEKELAGTDLNFCCKCGAKLIGSEKMNGGAK